MQKYNNSVIGIPYPELFELSFSLEVDDKYISLKWVDYILESFPGSNNFVLEHSSNRLTSWIQVCLSFGFFLIVGRGKRENTTSTVNSLCAMGLALFFFEFFQFVTAIRAVLHCTMRPIAKKINRTRPSFLNPIFRIGPNLLLSVVNLPVHVKLNMVCLKVQSLDPYFSSFISMT